MVAARVRIVDKTANVKKAAQTGSFRSLGHASAFLFRVARNSIKRRKTASLPGRSPNTQTGHLKRVIRYEAATDRKSYTIGPVNQYAQTIWDNLEFGGTIKPRRMLAVKKHAVGDYGPVAITNKAQRADKMTGKAGRDGRKDWRRRGYVRVKLRSDKQAARADRLIEAENAARREENAKPVRIDARPFMGPALKVTRPRMPKFWRNSVSA